jgi:formylglycine-generating enzyme required for sulfatase activity
MIRPIHLLLSGLLLAAQTGATEAKSAASQDAVRPDVPGQGHGEPKTAILKLSVQPAAGTRVFLVSENERQARAGPREASAAGAIELKPDRTYRVYVSAPGHQTTVFEVRAKRGETLVREIALVPWPSPTTVGERPAARSIPLDEAGKVTLELVGISAGTFVMGSEPVPSEVASRMRGDEWIRTAVTLTKPYWLGRTEVTQAQWVALGMKIRGKRRAGNFPAEEVSWDEAVEFCRRLTERERTAGRLPAGFVYTLPTEAQWEFACRAGSTGDHAGELKELAWYVENSRRQLHPVAQKQANAWGLHDMHGNTWEWCRDRYARPLTGGALVDPTGPDQGAARVRRGGDWLSTGEACRSSNRAYAQPATRYQVQPDRDLVTFGFRVALTSEPPR